MQRSHPPPAQFWRAFQWRHPKKGCETRLAEMDREHRGEHERDQSEDPAGWAIALDEAPNANAEVIVVVADVLGWVVLCANLQVTSFPLLDRLL